MAIKSTNQFRDDSTWVWWTHLRFFGNIFGINRITFDFPNWTLVVSIHILPKYCIIASIYERCFLNAHFLYLLRPWKLMICIFILCLLLCFQWGPMDKKYGFGFRPEIYFENYSYEYQLRICVIPFLEMCHEKDIHLSKCKIFLKLEEIT